MKSDATEKMLAQGKRWGNPAIARELRASTARQDLARILGLAIAPKTAQADNLRALLGLPAQSR